jgi:hypothetical protein
MVDLSNSLIAPPEDIDDHADCKIQLLDERLVPPWLPPEGNSRFVRARTGRNHKLDTEVYPNSLFWNR